VRWALLGAVAQQSTAPTNAVRVVGAPRALFRDFYHRFLRMPWSAALGMITVLFLVLNALYACLYLVTGGIAHARPGSFADAFYFSVQTMGTIGYGQMYPESTLANALMVSQAVVSLMVTAVATGLVFAKFSQSQARVVFSDKVTITPMDGVPTLMLRVGNERSNQIVEAQIRLAMIRTERTREGMTLYRLVDLTPSRERSPAFARSWTVLHPITPTSPLHGFTPDSVKREEIELIASLVGVDETSLQPVHARHRYTHDQIVWGARHSDVLTENEDGSLVLDLTKFHEVQETVATDEFPYGSREGQRE
jgi:inward rectifier potassium channel